MNFSSIIQQICSRLKLCVISKSYQHTLPIFIQLMVKRQTGLESRAKACDLAALPVKELSCIMHLLYARCHTQALAFITLINPQNKSWKWEQLSSPAYTQTNSGSEPRLHTPARLAVISGHLTEVYPMEDEWKGYMLLPDLAHKNLPCKILHAPFSFFISWKLSG